MLVRGIPGEAGKSVRVRCVGQGNTWINRLKCVSQVCWSGGYLVKPKTMCGAA